MSEIIIDSGGRVLVRNLSGELLEALGDSIGGGPAMEARYRKLRKSRKAKTNSVSNDRVAELEILIRARYPIIYVVAGKKTG